MKQQRYSTYAAVGEVNNFWPTLGHAKEKVLRQRPSGNQTKKYHQMSFVKEF